VTSVSEAALDEPRLFDPEAPLTASGNLRRRGVVSRLFDGAAAGAALIAVAMLLIVVLGVVIHGAPALGFGFVTHNPSGLASGGIFNYLLGTFVIVAFGALLALPIGILTGLYLTEFAGARSRTGRALTLALDLLQGIPTIIVGLFIFGLIVLPLHRDSGWAAGIALAIIMLPLIARSSQEVLLLVPNNLREAADALGVSRWRAVRGVILPSAIGGIVTGAILATARAAGETAPLLILDNVFNTNSVQLNIFGHGVPNVPMLILTTSDLALPDAFTRAWGAAFVLLVLILLANILARVVLARSRRKGRA
jgi:phosphate transport system permease protein